jgi:NAD(P)-dependent dehydrogenase (short-subunit alcohol dehydrogenase family)
MSELNRKQVVVVGRATGIDKALIDRLVEEGANVLIAGRHPEQAESVFDSSLVRSHYVDVLDDESIERLAAQCDSVDHLVSTVSARARGHLSEISRESLRTSFDTKVIGPIMLAKAFQKKFASDGSLTLFSGVAAFKPTAGYLGVAATNGAVDTLTRSLAVELAPLRVNAISPGVIDTGAWDAFGEEGKRSYFDEIRAHNLTGTIGHASDIAAAVIFAMTNPFMTGITLRVDGGEPLG